MTYVPPRVAAFIQALCLWATQAVGTARELKQKAPAVCSFREKTRRMAYASHPRNRCSGNLRFSISASHGEFFDITAEVTAHCCERT